MIVDTKPITHITASIFRSQKIYLLFKYSWAFPLLNATMMKYILHTNEQAFGLAMCQLIAEYLWSCDLNGKKNLYTLIPLKATHEFGTNTEETEGTLVWIFMVAAKWDMITKVISSKCWKDIEEFIGSDYCALYMAFLKCILRTGLRYIFGCIWQANLGVLYFTWVCSKWQTDFHCLRQCAWYNKRDCSFS